MPDKYGVIGFYAESDMSQFSPAVYDCNNCGQTYYENEPECWDCGEANPDTGMYQWKS